MREDYRCADTCLPPCCSRRRSPPARRRPRPSRRPRPRPSSPTPAVRPPGAPVTPTADTLHRIDPAFVRTEVTGAGFEFAGENQALRNPADPHTVIVFDPSIRGKTDQFVYLFRKP